MSSQPIHHNPAPPPAGEGLPPVGTLQEIRAALRAGYGMPGDAAGFDEALLAVLMPTAPVDELAETGANPVDLLAVEKIAREYRGAIRMAAAPGFEAELAEGIALAYQVKGEAGR